MGRRNLFLLINNFYNKKAIFFTPLQLLINN